MSPPHCPRCNVYFSKYLDSQKLEYESILNGQKIGMGTLHMADSLPQADVLLFRYSDDDEYDELLIAKENHVKVLPFAFFEHLCGRNELNLLQDSVTLRRWSLGFHEVSPTSRRKKERPLLEALLGSIHRFGSLRDEARELEEVPHTVPDFLVQSRLVPSQEKKTIYVLFLEAHAGNHQGESPRIELPKNTFSAFLRAYFNGMTISELSGDQIYVTDSEFVESRAGPSRGSKRKRRCKQEFGVYSETLSEFFPVRTSTERLKCRSQSTGRWKNLHTQRYHVLDLIAIFEEFIPSDAFALLVITAEDIYETENDSTTGRATGDGVGVISTFRFNPLQNASIPLQVITSENEKRSRDQGKNNLPSLLVWEKEVFKTAAHELGHIFGLDHCVFSRCLMNAVQLEESTHNSFQLCPIDVRKLQLAIGFDLRERYEKLREFFQQIGEDSESDFMMELVDMLK